MNRLDKYEHCNVPMTAETSPAEFDVYGRDGWELVGFTAAHAWFKRSIGRRQSTEMVERHARGECSV